MSVETAAFGLVVLLAVVLVAYLKCRISELEEENWFLKIHIDHLTQREIKRAERQRQVDEFSL